MSKWPKIALQELADIFGGSTPSRTEPSFWGGEIPWITPTDLPMPESGISVVAVSKERITKTGLDNCSATLVPVGTVLFSSRATIGKVAVAEIPLTTNQGFVNFIPKPAITSRFLAYALWGSREDIARLAGSTTFKEVSRSAIRKFEISVPPLPEQERIVKLLDEADALRKLRNQADKRSAEIIPALFNEMFGDVETNTKGWKVKTLNDICEINPRTSAIDHSPDSQVSFVPMSAVSQFNGSIINSERRTLKDVKKGFTPFIEEDVLFAKITPCMENGKAAIARKLINGVGYGSTEFHVLRPKTGIVPEWVFSLIHRSVFRKAAVANFTGTAGQQRVPTDFLRQYRIPVPPLPLQQEFASHVSEIRAMESEQSSSRQSLDALFQSMLHRAFQGEL